MKVESNMYVWMLVDSSTSDVEDEIFVDTWLFSTWKLLKYDDSWVRDCIR